MSLKIGLIALGCAKNRVDAEILLGLLNAAGYEIINDASLADIVIVNTCAFIEDAKKESIEEIFNAIRMKSDVNVKSVIVTGCLAERYRDEIVKEIPEVDAVVGIGSNKDIVQIVNKVANGQKISKFGEKNNLPMSGPRIRTTPSHYAYLKIAEGCDNKCSYCSIPYIRGNFRSRPIEDVVGEAKELAQSGVKEVLVIAQDTTRYGEDLYGKKMLAKLLCELCKIDGLKWIRVLYCYPDKISDELLSVIASEPKIVKYIDLPIQHCRGNVLTRMNRCGDKVSLESLIRKIREKIPGVTVRTTFIVGFPGETDEDFDELVNFCKSVKFDRMGCFAYSREEDTPAAGFEGQVPDKVKFSRQDIMSNLQKDIMFRKNSALLGKTMRCIVDSFDEDENVYIGRTEADAPEVDCEVLFVSKENLNAGEFVDVKITSYNDFDLVGEIDEFAK